MAAFYNPNSRTGYTKCRYCGSPIIFDPEIIGRNGRPVPLDPDTRSAHRCFNIKADEESTSSASFNSKTEEDQSNRDDNFSSHNIGDPKLVLENHEKLNRLKEVSKRILLNLDQIVITSKENRQLLEKILQKISNDQNINGNSKD